jgi:hypothetical protein
MKNINKIVILLFCSSLIFFCSCTKESSCADCNITTTDTTLTDSTMYTDCVIDGIRYFNISGREGCGAEYWGGGSLITHNYFATVSGKPVTGNATNKNSLIFYRGEQLIDTTKPLKAQKANYFAPGSYAFKTVYGVGNGVALTWTDANGRVWQTDFGNGDQTGSSFTITFTSLTVLPNGVVSGVNVSAIFSCNLYDGIGNVKKITNGRFRLPIWI